MNDTFLPHLLIISFTAAISLFSLREPAIFVGLQWAHFLTILSLQTMIESCLLDRSSLGVSQMESSCQLHHLTEGPSYRNTLLALQVHRVQKQPLFPRLKTVFSEAVAIYYGGC
ncbi:hypothetical protein CDAR_593361 [Caerostris darwini]|uniref:Uncharacterized protein n=1 Tax=Caerostris darwini TaxID=1538125 RepID=A0AAV4UWM0_9ARAC|nr:hypothetical protein CDAR_593361 [Caerostris darwini]